MFMISSVPCGGLGDLVDTLKLLVNKGVRFVSIQDGLTVDDSEIGRCTMQALIVAQDADRR